MINYTGMGLMEQNNNVQQGEAGHLSMLSQSLHILHSVKSHPKTIKIGWVVNRDLERWLKNFLDCKFDCDSNYWDGICS